MKIYIINERGESSFHRQLWVNGKIHRATIGNFTYYPPLEIFSLCIKEDNDLDEVEREERDRHGNWDQKLKWSFII